MTWLLTHPTYIIIGILAVLVLVMGATTLVYRAQKAALTAKVEELTQTIVNLQASLKTANQHELALNAEIDGWKKNEAVYQDAQKKIAQLKKVCAQNVPGVVVKPSEKPVVAPVAPVEPKKEGTKPNETSKDETAANLGKDLAKLHEDIQDATKESQPEPYSFGGKEFEQDSFKIYNDLTDSFNGGEKK